MLFYYAIIIHDSITTTDNAVTNSTHDEQVITKNNEVIETRE